MPKKLDSWDNTRTIQMHSSDELHKAKLFHAEDMLYGYDDESLFRHLDKAQSDVESYWIANHRGLKYSKFYPKFAPLFPGHTLNAFIKRAIKDKRIQILTTTKRNSYVFPSLDKFVIGVEYAWEIVSAQEQEELDDKNALRRHRHQKKTGAKPRKKKRDAEDMNGWNNSKPTGWESGNE